MGSIRGTFYQLNQCLCVLSPPSSQSKKWETQVAPSGYRFRTMNSAFPRYSNSAMHGFTYSPIVFERKKFANSSAKWLLIFSSFIDRLNFINVPNPERSGSKF